MNSLRPTPKSILSPLKIAAIYAVFGALWIYFSDALLRSVVDNTDLLTQLQTWKGWFYVFVTAALVFALTRQLVNSLKAAQDELQTLNETLEFRVEDRTRELGAREAYLRAVVDGSAEAIITLDEMGRIETFNMAGEKIFGYAQHEIVGKTISALLPPEKRASHEDFLFDADRFAHQIVGKPMDLEAQRSDGSLFPVKMNVAKIHVDGAVKFVGIMRDISDRKRLEMELITAKTSAENANRAKSEFLSAMSHELRTPLNAIIGFSDFLLCAEPDTITDENREDYLRHIKSSGNHLLELINEVLDLAKIESGALTLHIEDLSPAPVVAECMELLQAQADARHIQIHFEAAQLDAHKLRADRTRLKQILLNLMSNGLKYNAESGSLTIRSAPQGTDKVRISITDTGAGIQPKDTLGLFQPFNRLDAEDRGIEGTGIGLSVCKELAELMGGEIGVNSTVGQGSTFWFDLPQAKDLPKTEAGS